MGHRWRSSRILRSNSNRRSGSNAMKCRAAAIAIFPLAFLAASAICRADITVLDGDKLTVATRNLTISFRGADIVRVQNHLTSEVHFNSTARLAPLLDMEMLKGGSGNRRCSNWRPGRPDNEGIVNAA